MIGAKALLLSATVGHVAFAQDPNLQSQYDRYHELSPTYSVYWTVDVPAGTIDLALEVQTTGWVGFGISPAGGMDGADIVTVTMEGAAFSVQDRHAVTGYSAPSEDDKCSDWELLEASEVGGVTVAKLRRSLNTGDPLDIALADTNDATNIIGAYHSNSAIFQYHGATTRWNGAVNFFSQADPLTAVQSKVNVGELETATFLNSVWGTEYAVPTDETTYYDICVPLSHFGISQSSPADLVATEHVVDMRTEANVHHFVLTLSRETCTNGVLSDDVGGEDLTIYAWARGIPPTVFPDGVGIELGDGEHVSMQLQTHFDNPMGLADLLDASGVRIYFTPPGDTARRTPVKAGTIVVGDPTIAFNGESIGTGLSKWSHQCPESCIGAHFQTSATIFERFYHMHQSGVKIVSRQYRGNELIDTTTADYYSAENQFTTRAYGTIEASDRFELDCYMDNNKYPREDTTWGLGSANEMCMLFITYYPFNPNIENCGTNFENPSASCLAPENFLGYEAVDDLGRAFDTQASDYECGRLSEEPEEPEDEDSIRNPIADLFENLPFDPSELDPSILEGLDLYELLCRGGIIDDCSMFEGIVLDRIPNGACDDDKQRLCDITADISDIVQDQTCQRAIGLEIPNELQQIITAGSYCFNTLLCGRGTIERCLDQVSGILSNAEDNFGMYNEEIIRDIVAGVQSYVNDPISLVPSVCDSGCFDKFTNIVRGGYEFIDQSEDCVAALSDMNMDEMDLPSIPVMDEDLSMEFPSLPLPSMDDLPADPEEFLILLESGCTRNEAGTYCVEQIYNTIAELGVFGAEDESAGEEVDTCQVLQDLGCCANLILTNPIVDLGSEARIELMDQAAMCEPPESAFQTPCTDGLKNPVVIVTSAVTLPAVYIEEEDLIDGIATGCGVSSNSVIITEWLNRIAEPQTRRLLQNEQEVSFEIVLRGSMAETENVDAVSNNIVSDAFVQEVATALPNVEAEDITVETPVSQTFEPESDDGDESLLESTYFLVGVAVGGFVLVSALVVAFVKSRRTQQKSASKDIELGKHHSSPKMVDNPMF